MSGIRLQRKLCRLAPRPVDRFIEVTSLHVTAGVSGLTAVQKPPTSSSMLSQSPRDVSATSISWQPVARPSIERRCCLLELITLNAPRMHCRLRRSVHSPIIFVIFGNTRWHKKRTSGLCWSLCRCHVTSTTATSSQYVYHEWKSIQSHIMYTPRPRLRAESLLNRFNKRSCNKIWIKSKFEMKLGVKILSDLKYNATLPCEIGLRTFPAK